MSVYEFFSMFANFNLPTSSGKNLSDMFEKKSPPNPYKRPTEADQFSTDSTNGSLSGFLSSCWLNKLRLQQSPPPVVFN